MPAVVSNLSAVIAQSFWIASFAAPPSEPSPTLNAANVCGALVTVSEPVPSSVTALPAGNAPVAASSAMPHFAMRVGPAHACGTMKRKPELRVALPAVNVTPLSSSSGYVVSAVIVLLMLLRTFWFASVPTVKVMPRVPILKVSMSGWIQVG